VQEKAFKVVLHKQEKKEVKPMEKKQAMLLGIGIGFLLTLISQIWFTGIIFLIIEIVLYSSMLIMFWFRFNKVWFVSFLSLFFISFFIDLQMNLVMFWR